jgi:hypothetical protein
VVSVGQMSRSGPLGRAFDLLDCVATSSYTTAVQKLRARWRSLDRGTQISWVGLFALLMAAAGVRLWLMVSYSPAFLGYPDSSQYTLAAETNIFRDPQRPAGYPFFLRLIHHLSDKLTFVIAVQHLAGIATGLLYYKAVRRTGAPPWLGLLPAAVVFFGGTGLILEHSLLSDSLFSFLQAVAVYAAVCALYEPSIRWSLLAGTAIGLSFWVRTAGISIGVLVPVVLLWAAPGRFSQRLRRAGAAALIVAAMVGFYVGSQYYFTGYLGDQRQSAWDIYGRVSTFVDCSAFTPPSGTSFLCPTQPVGHRESQAYYQFDPRSPAVKVFGPPYAAPPDANAVLERFSVAAIENEPFAWAGATLKGLSRYVFPRSGEGAVPDEMLELVTFPEHTHEFEPVFESYFAEDLGYVGSKAELHPLSVYQSFTSVQGPLIVLLLIAAIIGPFFLAARMRAAAILFTLTAIITITFAVAGNGYDARFAYPTFGPLAAGAALGGWGIYSRLAGSIRRRSRDRRGRPPDQSAKTHVPALD